MINSLIYRLLRRRHFWRYATFDEVAELYASRLMRVLAQFMINMFVALYLYHQGYSLLFITMFYGISSAFRIVVAFGAAKFIATYGPKHAILIANLLYIPALVFFTFVPSLGLFAVIAFGFFQSLSMVTYDLAHMVDFSKVKHAEHAGKEIGYMQILERLTAGLSPFIGGTVAYLVAPEATMWLSAIIFAVASAPLFQTKEQVRLNQKLDYRRFPWRTTWRTIRAETAVGVDIVTSGFIWVLFIAIVIIASTSNQIYFTIGAFISVTIFTSFIAAYMFGRIIDWKHGGDLLKVATIGNALTHIFRPFVSTPAGIVAANITNEIATTGYNMAYTRGIFDTADRAQGHRIVYLSLISAAMSLGGLIACTVFAALLLICPTTTLAFQLFFVFSSMYVLLTMTARFRLYQ